MLLCLRFCVVLLFWSPDVPVIVRVGPTLVSQCAKCYGLFMLQCFPRRQFKNYFVILCCLSFFSCFVFLEFPCDVTERRQDEGAT